MRWDQAEQQEPQLPLFEFALFPLAVVDLFSKKVGVIVKGQLNEGVFTRRVPESPQKPFLLKSLLFGIMRKVGSSAALVRAVAHFSCSRSSTPRLTCSRRSLPSPESLAFWNRGWLMVIANYPCCTFSFSFPIIWIRIYFNNKQKIHFHRVMTGYNKTNLTMKPPFNLSLKNLNISSIFDWRIPI